MDIVDFAPVIISLVVGILLCIPIIWPLIFSRTQKSGDQSGVKAVKRQQNSASRSASQKSARFSHMWLASSLKGHTDTVLSIDVSPNGKYILTASDDGTCLLWGTRELEERKHKNVCCKLESDWPLSARFTPDSHAACVALRKANTIQVYGITQLSGFKETAQFPRLYDAADLLSFTIAAAGKYVLFAYTDTRIQLVSLSGELLSSFDSLVVRNTHVAVSHCSRFIAVCGFSREVRIWEVKFLSVPSKAKTAPESEAADLESTSNQNVLISFVGVVAAYKLSDHKDNVCYVGWSADSRRLATVSYDATWNVYNVAAVQQSGSPSILFSGTHTFIAHDMPVRAAFASDGLSLAIASGDRLQLYCTDSENCRCTEFDFGAESNSTEPDHAERRRNVQWEIQALSFCCNNQFLLAAVGNCVYVLHNVVGIRARIAALSRRHLATSDAKIRDFLGTELTQAKRHLTKLEKKIIDEQEEYEDQQEQEATQNVQKTGADSSKASDKSATTVKSEEETESS